MTIIQMDFVLAFVHGQWPHASDAFVYFVCDGQCALVCLYGSVCVCLCLVVDSTMCAGCTNDSKWTYEIDKCNDSWICTATSIYQNAPSRLHYMGKRVNSLINNSFAWLLDFNVWLSMNITCTLDEWKWHIVYITLILSAQTKSTEHVLFID